MDTDLYNVYDNLPFLARDSLYTSEFDVDRRQILDGAGTGKIKRNYNGRLAKHGYSNEAEIAN